MPSDEPILELTLARTADTAHGPHPHLVHLWWRAPRQGDRLVRVFVDGELFATTLDPSQRELWLTLDRSVWHVIQLVTVDVARLNEPALAPPAPWEPPPRSHVSVTLTRDERIDAEAWIEASINGVVTDRAPLWPADEPRGGLGGTFGLGAFGVASAAAPGLGCGSLGRGRLGSDASTLAWRRRLPAGVSTVRLEARTPDGRPAAEPVEFTAESPAPPSAASALRIDPDFTLRWN